jgi:hypothetical protein
VPNTFLVVWETNESGKTLLVDYLASLVEVIIRAAILIRPTGGDDDGTLLEHVHSTGDS